VHDDQTTPLPLDAALRRLSRCAAAVARLLARRQLHQPTTHVGRRLAFADGTSAVVYRETVVEHGPVQEPVVLVVTFRLRGVHGRGHAAFRAESLLNTSLFAGFPGFVSKLWLSHDERGAYRGLYQWDGAERAEDYVRALWWPLALVSHRASIHHQVVPGLWRDGVLRDPSVLSAAAPGEGQWWRLERAEPVPA
jgi:hypothetical protein